MNAPRSLTGMGIPSPEPRRQTSKPAFPAQRRLTRLGWRSALVGWVLWFALGVLVAAEPPWTLPAAIEFALKNNPETRLAEQRIALARASLDQANAGFWPKLRLESSYIRTDHPVTVFGAALNQREFYSANLDFDNVPDADNLNVKGLITVPLYAGGRNRAANKMARAGQAAAQEEAVAVHQQVAFEVARAFYTIQKAREFIRTAVAAVQSFDTNLAVAKRRFETGTLLRAEVLDVEVRLAQAREDLLRTRNAYALSLRALRNLLGLEQQDLEVVDALPSIAAPDPETIAERAELQAAQSRTQAAERAVQLARSGYRPGVDAFTSLDYDYGWKFDGDGTSYTAGVMLHWNIWDGRQTQGQVHEARAKLESAREEERRLKLAIDLEVEQARLHWSEAKERLGVTERAVVAAEESAQLTRLRFEQGLALATQLIDAETALTAVRVRRAEAEVDLHLAIAAWRKALGLPQIPEQPAIQ
jgi:outer membrane protein